MRVGTGERAGMQGKKGDIEASFHRNTVSTICLSLIKFKLLFWELENCVMAFKNWWPRLLTAGYIKKQWLEKKVITERPVKLSFKPSRKGPVARTSSDGRSGVRLCVIQDGEKIINMYDSWQFFLLSHKQETEAMDFNSMVLKYN